MNPIEQLESDLIALAKATPPEDYYVGSTGDALRDILKKYIKKRYPEKEIDPPRLKESRPEGIDGMLWDEQERFSEYAARKIAENGGGWEKLLQQEPFPEKMGETLSGLSEDGIIRDFLDAVEKHPCNHKS